MVPYVLFLWMLLSCTLLWMYCLFFTFSGQLEGHQFTFRPKEIMNSTIIVRTLECACCGDDGALSDKEGYFNDGQELICGCPGQVTVDLNGAAYINNGVEHCPIHDKV